MVSTKDPSTSLPRALASTSALVLVVVFVCHAVPCGMLMRLSMHMHRYKMNVGAPGYANKRDQNPSYCDRVLWKSRPGLDADVRQDLYEGTSRRVTVMLADLVDMW